MSVHTSKNAELFLKALEDVWVAEQTWHGSPNNATAIATMPAKPFWNRLSPFWIFIK
jgi:hypothetical protein